MGQIFKATVYDTKSRQCYSEDADKFHANCYSCCSVVCNTHYLLRQAPYNVMWCGGYVVLNNAIERFLSEDKLLGISVNEDLDSFQHSNENLSEKPYFDSIKFIDEAHRSWEHMSVWKAAEKYFDFKKTHIVTYDGYLVNHTKKQAINLKDYYEKSISLTTESKEEYAIDLIPPLTETGDGTLMALFDGCSADVTEKLIGTWCGDLLQIVDTVPDGYEEISCCFAAIWARARYCKDKFGTDEENFILKNDKKERFEAIALSYYLTRGKVSNIQIVHEDDGTFWQPVAKE